jgi:hypothetical protein
MYETVSRAAVLQLSGRNCLRGPLELIRGRERAEGIGGVPGEMGGRGVGGRG